MLKYSIITKTSLLIMCREIIAVYSENETQPIKTPSVENN
jgi:hypothetical protein